MANNQDGTNAWGTLIAIKRINEGDFEEGNAIKLTKNAVTIGRLQGCDFAHTDNNLLSGQHCKLIFDAENGKTFLCDTSKNGTLLNSKKVKNEMVEMYDGSVIRCVYKKNEPNFDVTYLFKSSNIRLNKDQECDTLEIEATQEYINDSQGNLESIDDNVRKRRAKWECDDDHKSKLVRLDSTCRPKSIEGEKKISEAHDEEVEENLTCGICQDIFHECISAQPCMHSFCAACYSQWMAKSNNCPSCRKVVKQVGKNHIVNNLVAAFLKKHPDCQRSEEELKEMDQNDKIKNKTVTIDNQGSCQYFENDSVIEVESSEEYDDSDDDDDDDDDISEIYPGALVSPSSIIQPPNIISRVPSVFSRSPMARCRQCPYFSSESSSSSSCGSCSSSSADSSASSDFKCSLNQVHIYCSCCQQCFPDRRNTVLYSSRTDAASNNANIDVQCSSCGRLFCHLYWGCRKPGCLGCLNKFKDFNFGNDCLARILNDNVFESDVFKHYLTQKNMDVIELLRVCIEKFQNKEFTVPSRLRLSENDIVCFSCGLRYFKELAYQFRGQIPRGDLPNDVTSREDCYWGRNCRTQRHNNNHARHYNHICEQTRFV